MPLVGGLGGPEFGSLVNPIPTRGADYDQHITACPPGFENLTASLLKIAGLKPRIVLTTKLKFVGSSNPRNGKEIL